VRGSRHIIPGNKFELVVNMINEILIEFVVRLMEHHTGITFFATRFEVFHVIGNIFVVTLENCYSFLLLKVLNELSHTLPH